MSRDRMVLNRVAKSGNGKAWDVLYYSKRLMQINADDADAEQAVRALRPLQFLYTDTVTKKDDICPLFGRLTPAALLSLLKEGELIERSSGSVLCQEGDFGDTMFVILKGGVSVHLGERQLALISPGQIVGELAFALRRSRTATLKAVGPTALLSLSASRVNAVLHLHRDVRQGISLALNSFIFSRVIGLVCHGADYFAPLVNRAVNAQVQVIANKLANDAKLVSLHWKDGLLTRDHRKLKANGLYLLAGGKLRNQAFPENVLAPDDYPVIYSSCEGGFVDRRRSFQIEGEHATLLFISQKTLQDLGSADYRGALNGLKQHLAKQYVFDVFISYNRRHNLDTAQRWRDALTAEGLSVFLDEAETNVHFKQIIMPAIVDSRVFLPLLSDHTRGADAWVQREIDYRRTVFDCANCAMIPVAFAGADPKQVDGHSMIDAVAKEPEAIRQVISAVVEVKNGKKVPFAIRSNYPDSI